MQAAGRACDGPKKHAHAPPKDRARSSVKRRRLNLGCFLRVPPLTDKNGGRYAGSCAARKGDGVARAMEEQSVQDISLGDAEVAGTRFTICVCRSRRARRE